MYLRFQVRSKQGDEKNFATGDERELYPVLFSQWPWGDLCQNRFFFPCACYKEVRKGGLRMEFDRDRPGTLGGELPSAVFCKGVPMEVFVLLPTWRVWFSSFCRFIFLFTGGRLFSRPGADLVSCQRWTSVLWSSAGSAYPRFGFGKWTSILSLAVVGWGGRGVAMYVTVSSRMLLYLPE